MKNRTSKVIRFIILAGVLLVITLVVLVTSTATAQIETATAAAQSSRAVGLREHKQGRSTAGQVTEVNQLAENMIYLPVTAHDFCRDFLDDFSNSNSGWFVGDDAYVRSEYLNDEYRVFTRKSGYIYLYRAPTCPRQDYALEVDAHWVGAPGSSYGLIFGLADDYSSYYLFDMNTDYQMYRLLRRDAAGFHIVAPVAETPAVNGGTATNHLKVVRQGSRISLAINGTILFDRYDFPSTGLKDAGLVASPYNNQPNADARFDNFQLIRLTTTAGEAAFAGTEPGPVTLPAGRQASFTGRLEDLPAWDAAGP